LRASFGGPAAGATPHFAGVLLGREGKVALTHVAYRGTQPALLDVVGGQIAAAIGPVGDVIKFVGQPKYRILATTGARRSRFAPDVPTLVEQGYKDLVFDEWYGFFLPRGASTDLVQRMNQALQSAVNHPETEKGYGIVGLEAKTSSPEELKALLERDTARWGPIVKSIGFTATT
jgi:tripartite-type tricarboxylate transporter receptor subunit TctC